MNNEDPISILPQIKHVNTKLIHLLIMLNTNGKKPCHVLKWCHTFATLFHVRKETPYIYDTRDNHLVCVHIQQVGLYPTNNTSNNYVKYIYPWHKIPPKITKVETNEPNNRQFRIHHHYWHYLIKKHHCKWKKLVSALTEVPIFYM